MRCFKIELNCFTSLIVGERLLNMEMISCVEKPESREEDAVRFVPSSEPLEGIPHSVIHVGHRGFIFSPGNYYLSIFSFEFDFIHSFYVISHSSANINFPFLHVNTKRANSW